MPGEKLFYKKAKVDLLEMIQTGNQVNNPILFDGDIIIIKKASKMSPDVLKIAKGNFSPKFNYKRKMG